MPKVSAQHREARREQIIDAALRSFAAKGFQGASMADIIAEAGLSAGAIYGHFEGKQQLALAVAQRILGNRMTEFGERIAGGGTLPPPSEMLRGMVTGLTSEIHDVGVIVQLWGEGVTDPEMARVVGPIFDQVQGVMGPYLAQWAMLRRGMDEGAARVWALEMVPVLLGLGQGYIIQSALLPGFDADSYFTGVSSLLDGELP